MKGPLIAVCILFSNCIVAHARLYSDYITTEFNCYEPGEEILVRFSTSLPTMQNWVGIYKEDTNDEREPIQSQWSCGSHDEECESPGRLTFLSSLAPGKYSAHLKSVAYHGHKLELTSQSFTLKASCDTDDVVYVDKDVYRIGDDDILVSFERSVTKEGDAIGIFPMGSDDDDKPLLWLFTCGNQECREDDVAHGTLRFGSYTLEVGHYHAVLGQLLPDGRFVAQEQSQSSFKVVAASSSCKMVVSLSKSCDQTTDDIVVEFGNCNILKDSDKVAIYSATTTDHLFDNPPKAWIYTCGDDCRGSSSDDEILLEDTASAWPLEAGDYKAVLLRKNPGGPPVNFVSPTFRIVSEDRNCQSPPRLRASAH
jgi:hypothetical protein